MKISTCISRCSRAECYVLIDQLFEESLFLDGSSVKIMHNQDYFILPSFHKKLISSPYLLAMSCLRAKKKE